MQDRGPEVRPVGGQRRVEQLGCEVVGERVRQSQEPRQLGAEERRTEEPHLGEVTPAGIRRWVARRAVAGQEVVDELHDVVGKRVRLRVRRAPKGPDRHGVGPGRTPEPEVDPPRVQRLQGAELLGDDEGRVVGQHDAARSDAQGGGGVGQVGDQDGRRRAGDGGHPVVLRHPQSVVAEPFDLGRDLHRLAQGLGGGRSRGHGGEVEHGKRDHALSNTGAPPKLPGPGDTSDGVLTILAEGGFGAEGAVVCFATMFTFMTGQIDLDAMSHFVADSVPTLDNVTRSARFSRQELFELGYDAVMDGLKRNYLQP